MDRKLEMVKAYIRGALRVATPHETDRYMQGFEAGLRAVQDYIEAMERPIEELEKKNEDS